MLPDRVSNPRPLIYESGALPIALRGPALCILNEIIICHDFCLQGQPGSRGLPGPMGPPGLDVSTQLHDVESTLIYF